MAWYQAVLKQLPVIPVLQLAILEGWGGFLPSLCPLRSTALRGDGRLVVDMALGAADGGFP